MVLTTRRARWIAGVQVASHIDLYTSPHKHTVILQRRRWLNGSFFAAVYALAHVGQILRSGHSMGRKVMLMVESVYNLVNLIFAWFAIVSHLWTGWKCG